MTREEIENLSVVEPYYFETDIEKRWYEIGYINGLRDADAEPNLESLWHDASEEPQDKEEYILYNSEYNNNWFINSLEYILECCYNSWCEVVEKENIKQWAYVKDVFPKGGEK